MKTRVFARLMGVFLLVIIVAAGVMYVAVGRAWERSLREEIERTLVHKTQLLAERLDVERHAHAAEEDVHDLLRQYAHLAEARATLLDKAGAVIADSELDPRALENKAARPEVAAALKGEVGRAVRREEGGAHEMLLVAVPLREGAVRLAYPLTAVDHAFAEVQGMLLRGFLLAVLIAALMAALIAHTIGRRLQRIVQFAGRVAGGDLSARIAEASRDEIAQVAEALDTTARRLEESFSAVETSRQQLATLLDSLQDPVIAVDAERRVRWANGAMNRLTAFGVRQGAPLVGAVRDPDLLRVMEAALTQGQVRVTRVYTLAAGRVYSATAAPMPGGGAVAVLHDLTEMERVEQTRRDFIANVSHELRTPLTSIQGYTETLLETLPADGQAREFLEIIRRNAVRMSHLTEGLLVLARVESGEEQFEFRAVPAARLLADAAQNFQPAAQARGITLVTEEGPDSDLPVRADAEAVLRVFSNLIDNALKHAPAGTRVTLGRRRTEGGVEFFVRDRGPGIASEHLPRIFERFYRVDKARSREAGGSGLGLAIAKHIVLAHGGAIRAESELGRGATFAFSLPLAAVPPGPPPAV
jgi:two-component system phosphate regulon sensor histidine kinase PhoR